MSDSATIQPLIQYILSSRQGGFSDEMITQKVLQAGWDSVSIQQAFQQLNATRYPSNPKHRSKKGLFILVAIIILVATGFGVYWFTSTSSPTEEPQSSAPVIQQITPQQPSIGSDIIFSLSKGTIQGHDYDTYTQQSLLGYRLNGKMEQKAYVPILPSTIDPELAYTTSKDGKYLIRSTKTLLEVSPSTTIGTFQPVFTVQDGRIENFIVSQDFSKLVILYTQNGKKIVIQDIETGLNKISVPMPYQDQSYTLFGYDTVKKTIYWERSVDYMTHETEAVSIRDDGSIENTKKISDFSFITEFDSTFTNAYYEQFGTEQDGYKHKVIQQNLITGEKSVLAEFPSDFSLTQLSLSPDGTALYFINNVVSKPIISFYVLDIKTKKLETISVASGVFSSRTNYISPDGKYALFSGGPSCIESTCTHTYDSMAFILDISQKQFHTLYTPTGVNESNNDQTNGNHTIELFSFIGWVASSNTHVDISTLPVVTFQ